MSDQSVTVPRPQDKLAIYRGRTGLDLLTALSIDPRLRPSRFDGECVVSCVGLMDVFADANYAPRQVWADMKKRLFKRKNQLSEKILQLKSQASDGKWYKTDYASIETAFRILFYMDTPSSDEFKDLAALVLSRAVDSQLSYRARNIAGGMEWSADSIHLQLADGTEDDARPDQWWER